MSKYFVCCERCFQKIGMCNTTAAKLWMDLCALHLENNGVFVVSDTHKELESLETNGFVVSTESPNSFGTLKIKVNGHLVTTYGEHFFCLKDGNHVR